MSDIAIDGDPRDWGDRGFRLNLLCGNTTELRPLSEFNPQARIGWNDNGILLLFEVADSNIVNSPNSSRLFEGSSVEIVVAQKQGKGNNYSVVQLAPNFSSTCPNVYWYKEPWKKEKAPDVPLIRTANRRSVGGYIIEALLPWANTASWTHDHEGLGIQLEVFSPDPKTKQMSNAFWYPSDVSWRQPENTYCLQFTSSASPPIDFAVRPTLDGNSTDLTARAVGTKGMVGRYIELRTNESESPIRVIGNARFELEGDHSRAVFILQDSLADLRSSSELQIMSDGVPLAIIPRQGMTDAMRTAIGELHLIGQHVFTGSKFPEFTWSNPSVAKIVFGTETFSVDYFDESFRHVAHPERPGRYAAIFTIATSSGHVSHRFTTLCKAPDQLGSWVLSRDGQAALPKEVVALTRKMATQFPRTFDQEVTLDASPSVQDAALAIHLANLLSALPCGDPGEADSLWWAQFKNRFFKYDVLLPNLVNQMMPSGGSDSPTLREGTAREAGLNPSVVERLDSLCREGAARFPKEPLSFCFARNGIVFFHRAYGTLSNGKSMTLETPTDITSVSKVILGLLAAIAVDRKKLDLDEPVEGFLPEGRLAINPGRVSLRLIFNHRSGLDDHIQVGGVNLPEVVLDQLRYVKVGSTKYSSDGYNFIGDILSEMTGQPLSLLLKRLIFDPIGIPEAEQQRANGGAMLTAMELARIGQLLLNRGAYGSVRLLSEDVFEQMLPRREDGSRGGIGLESPDAGIQGAEFLPKNAFGHTTHHSGVFLILPDQKMVVVICAVGGERRAFGGNYHKRIFRTLLQSIER